MRRHLQRLEANQVKDTKALILPVAILQSWLGFVYGLLEMEAFWHRPSGLVWLKDYDMDEKLLREPNYKIYKVGGYDLYTFSMAENTWVLLGWNSILIAL